MVLTVGLELIHANEDGDEPDGGDPYGDRACRFRFDRARALCCCQNMLMGCPVNGIGTDATATFGFPYPVGEVEPDPTATDQPKSRFDLAFMMTEAAIGNALIAMTSPQASRGTSARAAMLLASLLSGRTNEIQPKRHALQLVAAAVQIAEGTDQEERVNIEAHQFRNFYKQ